MELKLKVDLIMDKEMNMQNFIKFNIKEKIIHQIGLIILIKKQIKQYEMDIIVNSIKKICFLIDS
jgi:hypothetical protein